MGTLYEMSQLSGLVVSVRLSALRLGGCELDPRTVGMVINKGLSMLNHYLLIYLIPYRLQYMKKKMV